jgi:hypothetical protein
MKFFHFVKFDLLITIIDFYYFKFVHSFFVVISQLFVNEFYMKSYFLDWDLLQRMMLFFTVIIHFVYYKSFSLYYLIRKSVMEQT